MNRKEAIDKLLRVAEAEIGYLEKESCSCLDDKTANAGDKNYTKYWRDILPEFQGEPWCAAFVSWCMMQAFGKEKTEQLLRHWPFVYCPTLASLADKHATPQKGDIVLFFRNGVYAHTGIVTEVTEAGFTTIEGNTSNGSEVIPNGGGVCKKSYRIEQVPGVRFIRPEYEKICARIPDDVNNEEENSTQELGDNSSGELSREPFAIGIVTASSLNVRKWAGTEYPRLSLIPSIPRGSKIEVCDSLYAKDGSKWYYVRIEKRVYGFLYAGYICIVSDREQHEPDPKKQE